MLKTKRHIPKKEKNRILDVIEEIESETLIQRKERFNELLGGIDYSSPYFDVLVACVLGAKSHMQLDLALENLTQNIKLAKR